MKTPVHAHGPRTWFLAYLSLGYVLIFEHSDHREQIIEQSVDTGPCLVDQMVENRTGHSFHWFDLADH